jgi:hypothetical protein
MNAICLSLLFFALPRIASTPMLFNEQATVAKQFALIRQSAKDSGSIKDFIQIINTNGYSNLTQNMWIDIQETSGGIDGLKKHEKSGEYIKNVGFYSIFKNPQRVTELYPKATSDMDWVLDCPNHFWLARLSKTQDLAILNVATKEIKITDAKPGSQSVEIFPMGRALYLVQSAEYSEETGYSRKIWIFDSNTGGFNLALEAQTESADVELEDRNHDGFTETLIFPVDVPSEENESTTDTSDAYVFKNNKFVESTIK